MPEVRRPRGPLWLVLRFTIREFLGVVAGLGVAGWVLRAAIRAEQDAMRVDRAPSLDRLQFFLRRLRSAPSPSWRDNIPDILDWHDRWDHYVLAGLAAVATMVAVALVARKGGPRRALVVLAVALCLLAPLVGRIPWRNREVLRRYMRWSATLERDDRDAIARLMPDEVAVRGRYLNDRLSRNRSSREHYEELATRPWYRLLLPLDRPFLAPFEL